MADALLRPVDGRHRDLRYSEPSRSHINERVSEVASQSIPRELPAKGFCHILWCWVSSWFYDNSSAGLEKAFNKKDWDGLEGLFREYVLPTAELIQRICAGCANPLTSKAFRILKEYFPNCLNPQLQEREVPPSVADRRELQAAAPVAVVQEVVVPPLYQLIQDGNTQAALQLIQAGADVNCQGPDGKTPLHLAIIGGFDNLIKALVERGASLAIQDGDGKTPLHYAAHADIGRMHALLGIGIVAVVSPADVERLKHVIDLEDHEGLTALDHAMLRQPLDFQVVRLLIECGSRKNIERHIKTLLLNGYFSFVVELTQIVPDQFFGAINSNREFLVQQIINGGITSNVAKKLLNFVSDEFENDDRLFKVCAKAMDGHYVDSRWFDIAEKIMAKTRYLTKDYGAVFNTAVKSKKFDFARKLVERHAPGINVTALLMDAVKAGRVEYVRTLLTEFKDYCSLAALDQDGLTAVHIAARDGRDEILNLLLDSNAGAHTPDKDGNRPLHLAAQSGHSNTAFILMAYLAKNDASVDIVHLPNKKGETPLDLANDELIKDVLKRGGAKTKLERMGAAAADKFRSIFSKAAK